MPVVFFDVDTSANKRNGESSHHLEAAKVLDQLNSHQRPDLDAADLKLPSNSKIVVLNPLDRIDHFPKCREPRDPLYLSFYMQITVGSFSEQA